MVQTMGVTGTNISKEIASNIDVYLESENIPLIASVPFDKEMVKAMVNGQSITEYNPNSGITQQIEKVWDIIKG
jgi:MinD superfamily P-loop ATPase